MVIALITLIAVANTSDTIDVAEFRKLHEELQPGKNEAWRSIPWRLSVLEGQRQAVATKKPMFIWAMDGHPLGCT